MVNTTKYLSILLCLFLLTNSVLSAKTKKNKSKGGKFNPNAKGPQQKRPNIRSRRPTLGDVLRSQGRGTPALWRPGNSNQVDHTNADAVNRRNYLNNLKNNNNVNSNNFKSNSGTSVNYPSVGKVIPPLRRAPGEKPPFAPSWTHCVITIQVSIAWVVVKSPHYPNKFQGQVQCSWIATAPEGYRVRLSFKDLDLLVPSGNGCGNQFVEVIDQQLEKSQARFCGTDTPGDYVSEGNKLRLDLQADAIGTPYRGFLAGFRADQEVPGMRETSYFAHGQPQLLYNPLTDSPPSNPNFPTQAVRRKIRRPTVPPIPGQRIYGVKDQPRYQQPEKEEDEDALGSSTTHLYIIIAVILVILVVAAAAYIFKRYFFKQFMAWRKSQKSGGQGETEMQQMEDVYGNKKTQLPGNMPLPPTPSQLNNPMLRRQSVSFKDGRFAGHPMDPSAEEMYPQSLPPSYHSTFGSLNRSHSMGDISNNWMQAEEEPIYEDDRMSVHSTSSMRSSNRHPDHGAYKRQKLLERQNSIMMRRNSMGGGVGSHPPQSGVFPIYNPYQTNSLYNEQPMYGQIQDNYGSLPPTIGPGSNGTYSMYPEYPMTSHPQFTSSMSNLDAGNHDDFMMQQYNGRSASVYDLSRVGHSPPDMTSQWSTQLDQRHASLTSSTNNSSTNPILKKTTPTPQNELAFSALRAAKSMNDLTAINTKLNECVSWTLPSQRRKSFAELPSM